MFRLVLFIGNLVKSIQVFEEHLDGTVEALKTFGIEFVEGEYMDPPERRV